jgi:hypothetical protein
MANINSQHPTYFTDLEINHGVKMSVYPLLH